MRVFQLCRLQGNFEMVHFLHLSLGIPRIEQYEWIQLDQYSNL